MRLGDAQRRQQLGHTVRFHGWSPVAVDDQFVLPNTFPLNRLSDQSLGQLGAFPRGQHPADYVPAEDVEDDV